MYPAPQIFGLLALLLPVATTLAAPANLDPTFAASGRLIADIGGSTDSAAAIALQPDRKIVLAGSCINTATTQRELCVARINSDGSLDTSFNSTGKVTVAAGTGSADARAVAVQPDGMIVVAGNCRNGPADDFCAIRLTPVGALDTGFGTSGRAIITVSAAIDIAYALAVQPDGKLLLAGACRHPTNANFDFCAVRLNSDGSADNTFGSSGISVTPVSTSADDSAYALALQPDGAYVLAGKCENVATVSFDLCAARFNSSGAPDASFASNGIFRIAPGGATSSYARSVQLQADGKIVVSGSCDSQGARRFCAVRLAADGSVDSSFDTTSVPLAVGADGSDEAYATRVQPDGKLLVAGGCSDAGRSKFCSARLNSDGSPDKTFSATGGAVNSVGFFGSTGLAAALDDRGRIVVAGECLNGLGDTDFCAIRYEGGPVGSQQCSMDLDGDNRVLPTTDSLIHARIALGITGNAVVNGISFPASATRTTWPQIRSYLVSQCGMSLPQ